MKSDGGSSETKMPAHLAEFSQQYGKRPNNQIKEESSRTKKADQERVKIMQSISVIIVLNCSVQHVRKSVGKSCALGQALVMLHGLVEKFLILRQKRQGSPGRHEGARRCVRLTFSKTCC